jgi:prostaglandin-endoperoxide synthase 2
MSSKSTLLFPHFAQWFVDGFLRTDPSDPLKTVSTHDIDLSQLYGQTCVITRILRSGVGGRLKSQMIDNREYPPYYFGDDGQIKREFKDLHLILRTEDTKATDVNLLDDASRRTMFALGLPRGNIHYGFTMMSTLFLREHNRIAGTIVAAHRGDPEWNDDRVFEVTRNTMIVLLLQIVIGDYINHISPFKFRLFAEPGLGERERWYRQNWMSLEFNLLYRWHALVPTTVTVGGQRRLMADATWNNEPVTSQHLSDLFDEASRQPCCDIGILNTPDFLLHVERRSIEIGRIAKLASFNDYRVASSLPPLRSFEDLTSDVEAQQALASRYGNIDDLELYVGLFAEDRPRTSALPTLMGTMVASDAFSQALTNPLLTRRLSNEETFSSVGLRVIESTSRLQDIVDRNLDGSAKTPCVSFGRVERPVS